MAKGILVSYAGYPHTLSSLFPDNGLASLAAVLLAEGHDIKIRDYNTAELIGRLVDKERRTALGRLLEELQEGPQAETVKNLMGLQKGLDTVARRVESDIARELIAACTGQRVDFIGFKLWSGDGFEGSVHIAQQVRENCPKVRLFAGGPAVHYSGYVVADQAPVFDAVINGDGEDAILELARFVEGKRSLRNIPNRVRASRQSLDNPTTTQLKSLPLPVYGSGVYPSVVNGGKLKLFSIDESRGCPMRCAFCINWCIEGSRWRTRSSAQVLQEIKALRSEYGSRAFRLAGTHSPPRFVREICSQIISEHLDVEFGLYLHAKGVTGDLLDMLKEAGCFGVFFGVESGSDEILARSMNKSTDVANLHHVLTSSIRRGLFTAGSFIFPAPFETELTEKCTKEFIVDVFYEQPNAAAILIFPGLLPGTLWWKNRERFGFELTVDEDFYRRILSSYKIRHLIPPIFWDPLPYTLNGQTQPELARRNAALQQWARQLGIAVNLGDHDVQVGVALGYEPFAFKEELVRLFFTGDGEAIQELVDRSNEVLAK